MGCKVEGCNNKGKLNRHGNRYFPRGFCSPHYKKWAKENKDIIERDNKTITSCSVKNCKGEPPYKKGLCRKHYRRLKKHGDVNSTQYRNEGQTEHPLYNTYSGIKKRCLNNKDKDYKNYGGRGIKICDEWLGKDGFFNFVEDMGYRPKGHTIDRKNCNGDYEPDNCRWADKHTQSINTRVSKHKGVSFHKITGKYRARIFVNGKSEYIGLFSKLEDAIQARKEAELKYLGKTLDYD